jgi:hypothetical protein
MVLLNDVFEESTSVLVEFETLISMIKKEINKLINEHD